MQTKRGNYDLILLNRMRASCLIEDNIKIMCSFFREFFIWLYGNYLLHDIINHFPDFTALFWSMTIMTIALVWSMTIMTIKKEYLFNGYDQLFRTRV